MHFHIIECFRLALGNVMARRLSLQKGKPLPLCHDTQDVLFYDQSTGELEIEASHQKHREVLRNSFAEGVMGDDLFFPKEEQTRVLNLQKLIELDFKLPVRTGHQVQITAVTLREFIARKPFTATLSVR